MSQERNNEILKAVNEKNLLTKQLTQSKMLLTQKIQIKRRSQLTLDELSKLPEETVTYRTVGRMFIRDELPDINKELNEIIDTETTEIEKLENNIEILEKKVNAAEADLRELMQVAN